MHVGQSEQQHHGYRADRDGDEGINQEFAHRQSLIILKMVRLLPDFQHPVLHYSMPLPKPAAPLISATLFLALAALAIHFLAAFSAENR